MKQSSSVIVMPLNVEIDESLMQDMKEKPVVKLKAENMDLDLNRYPISLDVQHEFKKVSQSGILRKKELYRVYDKVFETFSHPLSEEIVKNLFWVVFCVKFRENQLDKLQFYREILSDRYSRWFFELSNI